MGFDDPGRAVAKSRPCFCQSRGCSSEAFIAPGSPATHQRTDGQPQPRMRRQDVASWRQPEDFGPVRRGFPPRLVPSPRTGRHRANGMAIRSLENRHRHQLSCRPFRARQHGSRVESRARRGADLGLTPPGYAISPLFGAGDVRASKRNKSQMSPKPCQDQPLTAPGSPSRNGAR